MRTAMARGVLWSLLAAGFVVSAYAQNDNQVYSNLRFDLANPGARSLALGGAFTGLADDATAAYANPAGLTLIFKPQLSIEGRYSSTDTRYTQGGTYYSPAGAPFPQPFNGITTATNNDSRISPSFVSLMYPHGHWAAGVFRHELSHTAFTGDIGTVQTIAFASPGAVESIRLKMVDWGLAGAFNITENLTVGASLSYFQNSIRSSLTGKVPNPQVNQTIDKGSESKIAGNVGLLLKHGKASFGAVYHRSPDFHFASVTTVSNPPAKDITQTFTTDLKAPDAYGLGFVYRFTDTFYSTTDVQYVKYSQITDQYTSTSLSAFKDPATAFRKADATEVRIGFEKTFIRPTSPSVFALRIGAWHDPDHSTKYSGVLAIRSAYYLPAKALTHITGGLGFVFGELQADIGADVSSRSRVVSASIVKSFKPFSR